MVPGPQAEGASPEGGGPGPARPHGIFEQVTWLAPPLGTQPGLPWDFIPNWSLGQDAPVPRGGSDSCLDRTACEGGVWCPEGRRGGLCPEQLPLA